MRRHCIATSRSASLPNVSISALGVAIALSVALHAPVARSDPFSVKDSRQEYQHGEGIEYRFGSKFMSGYFTQEGSSCFVTLLIQWFDPESGHEVPPLSAVRMRFVIGPGQIAGLDSEEKRSLNLTCGEAGKVLTVDAGLRAPLVAKQRESLASDVALQWPCR